MILLLAVSVSIALGLMGLAYLMARRIGNFSVVDVFWSFNFTPLAAAAALLGSGLPGRRWLVFAMVTLWSLRLTVHLARRVAALHPVEEGRYLELRRQWADDVNGRFLRFFMFQGLLNAGLSLPVMFASLNRSSGPGVLELLGVLVFAISLTGEAVADAQLNAFRGEPENAGKVCRRGLWRYSRHPNYFFEWLVWCAYALIASAAPWGFVAWVCPALMLYFLLRVTGIKMTEEQSVRSRGQAYRDYQATTSAFLPWFPRRDARNTVTIK